jgi:hypothetical protein
VADEGQIAAPGSIQIPKPKPQEIQQISVDVSSSFVEALQEQESFAAGQKFELKVKKWDWFQKHVLKWILFGFVVWIDIWWTNNVLSMVWRSGTVGSSFHLNDSVLIALVSTSIGNFIALVAIVAKNLFPKSGN